jgi:thiol-disulfide isomerase/thioredoxin
VGLRIALLALALLAAGGFGVWRRRTDGRTRAVAGSVSLDAATLRAPLGDRATLVQFSTDFCAPCRAARTVLAAEAGRTPGVTHVEVDAAERTDLVHRFGIRRTPTVLVLDRAGAVVGRSSGVPRRSDLDAALTAVGAR